MRRHQEHVPPRFRLGRYNPALRSVRPPLRSPTGEQSDVAPTDPLLQVTALLILSAVLTACTGGGAPPVWSDLRVDADTVPTATAECTFRQGGEEYGHHACISAFRLEYTVTNDGELPLEPRASLLVPAELSERENLPVRVGSTGAECGADFEGTLRPGESVSCTAEYRVQWDTGSGSSRWEQTEVPPDLLSPLVLRLADDFQGVATEVLVHF